MRNHRAVMAISGLVAIAACTSLYLSLKGGVGPAFDIQPHERTGAILASQATSLLQPGGAVTIITRDTKAFKNPATDIQLSSLTHALKKARVRVEKIEALQVDPLRPVEVPAGDFAEMLRTTPKGSVIVSLMGPPLLTRDQRLQLGEVKPAVVAFCSGSAPEQLDLRLLFQQGLLHGAVASRPGGPKPGPVPKSDSGIFDHYYIAVTADNLAQLGNDSPSEPSSNHP